MILDKVLPTCTCACVCGQNLGFPLTRYFKRGWMVIYFDEVYMMLFSEMKKERQFSI